MKKTTSVRSDAVMTEEELDDFLLNKEEEGKLEVPQGLGASASNPSLNSKS
jgi:hypothetical protein